MNISHTTFSINLGSDWSVEHDGPYIVINGDDKSAYLRATEINSFCIDEGGIACISTRHALFRLNLRASDNDTAPSRGVRDLLKIIHMKLIAAEKLADTLNDDTL